MIKSLTLFSVAQGLGASSCSTLDRLFMGESSNLTGSVVIIGAGLSGLTCAYELKKLGIPFVIFESESRIGGQILTLNQYFGVGTWVDLGPEFYTPYDMRFSNLIKELGLKPQALSAALSLPSELKRGDLKLLYQCWQKLNHSSEFFARNSLADWGRSISKDSYWLEALDGWSRYRLGIDSEACVAFHFVNEFKSPDQHPWQTEEISVEGGMGQIIDRLASEVLGAFPEKKLRLRHQLQAIHPSGGDSWDFVFLTPEGKRRYEVKTVVLTLSIPALAQIEGMERYLSLPKQWPSTLSVKWAKPGSWQKAFRQLNKEPIWGRGFQKVGAWGQVRSQKFIEFGQSSKPEMVQKLGEDGICKDWSQQKSILGRGFGGLLSAYQPQWVLPSTWYCIQKADPSATFSSPIEHCIAQARGTANQIVSYQHK